MWDSPTHLLIVAAVILILFGGRKIPEMMKGLGQGIREFKEGMRGEPSHAPPPAASSSSSSAVAAEDKK